MVGSEYEYHVLHRRPKGRINCTNCKKKRNRGPARIRTGASGKILRVSKSNVLTPRRQDREGLLVVSEKDGIIEYITIVRWAVAS